MLRRLLACVLSLALCCAPLASWAELSTPSDLPTEQPSQEPTAVPSVEPSVVPSVEPSAVPGAEQSPAPGEQTPTQEPTVTPVPTEEPWDESQCDHANIHCEQAPACQVDGCQHIAQDVFGLDYPLCTLGQWLLDQQDKYLREGRPAVYSLGRNSLTINLNLADVTLWRSGTYTITGGENRPDAKITLAKDRVIVLSLRGATAQRLTLQSNVNLTLDTRDLVKLETLEMRQGSKLTLNAGGAMAVAEVIRPADTGTAEDTKVYITGGSLDANLTENKGRTLYRFNGQGATSVTVSGHAYPADTPQEDGSYCLWLSAPAEGMRWASSLEGETLRVYQTAKGGGQSGAIVAGAENVLTQAGTYTLSGQVADGTRLVVNGEQIQIVLKTATLPAGVTITGNVNYNLVLDGTSTAAADAFLQGGATATISGDGALNLTGAAPTAPLNPVSGVITLATAPAGWTAYPVAGITAADQLTVDGQSRGLCWNGADSLYLPTPQEGYRLVAARENGVIRAVTTPNGTPLFLLSSTSAQADVGDAASFEIQGPGATLDGGIRVAGATAAQGVLSNVQLASSAASALTVTGGKNLRITLRGDNALSAASAPIALEAGSSLTLHCAEGRLLLRGQSDLTGITLEGNVKVEPEVPGNYTKLLLKDKSGNPVVNQQLILRVNGQDYAFQTHYDGSIYLWGVTNLTGGDVVATNGTEVYTAVVAPGVTPVDPGVEISNVTAQGQADGSLTITFSAPEAGSAGVQYLVSSAGQPMADCYVAEAFRVAGLNQITLTGLTRGQVVSFRVYATRTAGVELTADNDDGFQFSDVYTQRVRGTYTAPESADAAYTGKAYVCPFDLPSDATVTYSGDDLNRDGKPWKVGEYVMHVTIPETSADYIPGTYDIDFKITKAVVYIIPDPNQEKFMGEMDPEFTFTTRGLLGDDQVWGYLTREEGEDIGNYAFTLDMLETEDYYTLRLPSDAYTFTILPGGASFPVFFYEMLHPVRQEIVRKDGRTVAVVLNTQDELTVTHSVIGNVVFATSDEKFRPFSPILRHNETTDEVLLQLRCEAELSEDGGYVTDSDGNPSYQGRFFRLSWLGLRNLNRLGVDSISLSQDGVQMLVRLEDFLNEDMQKTIEQLGGDLKEARFKMTLQPAADLPETEQAAVAAQQPMTDAWQASVVMLLDKQEIPFESYLPSLQVTVDAEPAAQILTGLQLYEEETFPDFCALTQVTTDGTVSPMESLFVTPFREDELEQVEYPQIMFTDRYYIAPMNQRITVFLKRK